MNNKKIGWTAYETIEYMNPISDMEAFLYDHYMACFKKYTTAGDLSAVKQLIAERAHSPRKVNLLREIINDKFPQYKELADKILMLAE